MVSSPGQSPSAPPAVYGRLASSVSQRVVLWPLLVHFRAVSGATKILGLQSSYDGESEMY